MSHSPGCCSDADGSQSSGYEVSGYGFRGDDDQFDEQFEARLRELPIPYGEIGEPSHGVGKSLDYVFRSDDHEEFSEEISDFDAGGVGGRSLVLGLVAGAGAADPAAQSVVDLDACAVADPGPSLCTQDSLADMASKFGLGDRVRGRVPKPHERPWDPPKGRICVYEYFFTECGLWFPIPMFLTDYCARREIAFSQLTPSSVRNAVGLAILGAKDRVEIDVDLFEQLTVFLRWRKQSGFCTISSAPRFKIVDGSTSKVRNWKKYYFFLKVDEFSIEDPVATHVVDWNFSAGSSWLDKVSCLLVLFIADFLYFRSASDQVDVYVVSSWIWGKARKDTEEQDGVVA